MKDMFYKYDHNVADRPPCFHGGPGASKHDLTHCGHTHLITNIKGEAQGVEAQENSTFKLFFSLHSEENDGSLAYMLANGKFTFEVFDRLDHVILTAPVEVYYADEFVAVELTSSSEGPLKCGIYKMQLYVEMDGKRYDIFSTSDGYLSIE